MTFCERASGISRIVSCLIVRVILMHGRGEEMTKSTKYYESQCSNGHVKRIRIYETANKTMCLISASNVIGNDSLPDLDEIINSTPPNDL